MAQRFSSAESRAAQAAMAARRREAKRAQAIADEYADYPDISPEVVAAARTRADALASAASDAQAVFEGEQYLARASWALADRPVLSQEQETRLRALLAL